MPAIACLITDRERHPLDVRVAAEAKRLLNGSLHWLADAEAVEILTPEIEPGEALARLAELLDDQPLDYAVLPTHHRRKQLLLCDMDSTVIEIECIDELADFAGIKPKIAAVTQQAMNGEIDFAAALRARVALLAGLPEEAIEQVIAERLTLTPGATTMVRTMRANGARTALVSGGFSPFTRHVQALCGFDEEEANGLEIVDGRLTGRVAGTVRDASAKLIALQRLRKELGLPAAATLAVGDGANDLAMVEAAGLGVGFRPHPLLRDRADACIEVGDLTAVLFLQGYRRDEFVTA
jgi:phosphoserine phosphatase